MKRAINTEVYKLKVLGDKKVEQLKKMPLIETKIFKSKDERFIVHKTIISSIKPVEYYRVIMDAPVEET